MKKNIAVLDDVYANRFLIEQCLSDYSVHSMPDAHSLYNYLKSEIPDLIIMDVGLPEEDGFSITKKLAMDDKYKDIPVIFVTAHCSKDDVIRGYNSGGYDYIVKPFDGDVLIKKVEQALMKKKFEHLN